MPADQRLVSYTEAGAYAHVSASTIVRWVREGKLTDHREGLSRYARISLDELDQLRADAASR